MSNSKLSFLILVALSFITIAIPCMTIQSTYLINGNISWLMQAAERLLIGETLAQNIYETNPPVSIILYIPHIITAQIFNIEYAQVFFPITFLAIIVSIATAYKMCRVLALPQNQIFPFIACFFAATSIATALSFGEREHYIILALVPMILCQHALSRNLKVRKRLSIPLYIVGTLAVLIKPHYGIIPAVLILNRLLKQKKLNALFQWDLYILVVLTTAYMVLLFTIFSDYTFIILPDVLKLYFVNHDIETTLKTGQSYITLFLLMPCVELVKKDLKPDQKSMVLLFYGCALLGLIPYFMQMKGYYYHVLPAYVFFLNGLSLSLIFRISAIWKKDLTLQYIVPTLSIISFLNVFSPLSQEVIKQKEIQTLPITTYIEAHCHEPCSFFAFHSDIEIFNPTALAMNYVHGTRFPVYWFLPELIKNLNAAPDNIENQRLKKKYQTYAYQDLKHYKPSLLLIKRGVKIINEQEFDFIEFFSEHPDMKTEIENNYIFLETKKFDRALYFKGTTLGHEQIMTFDVYQRTGISP